MDEKSGAKSAYVEPKAPAISADAEAGLRQFSRQRLIAYGLDFSDAAELRERVMNGGRWTEVALAMAHERGRWLGERVVQPSALTAADIKYRISALLRISQVLDLADSPDREKIYQQSASMFEQASRQLNAAQRVCLNTPNGRVAGWCFTPRSGDAAPGIVIIGGVEGWAMDFSGQAMTLAKKGFIVLALDGAGQGETRLLHRHYLTSEWPYALRAAFDFLHARYPDQPLGICGNSMGGSFATIYCGLDQRVRACCNNGGPPDPINGSEKPTFFQKMCALCGPVPEDESRRIWSDLSAREDTSRLTAAYLLVHGGRDPLVSEEDARRLYALVGSLDKLMHVFPQGDHCNYNMQTDRDALIGDWFAERLGLAAQF